MVLSGTPPKIILYQYNTNAVKISGLQDAISGNFVNNATIQATLVDDNGTPQTGCIEVALTYVSESNGDYIGTFGDSSFASPIGTGYTLVIDGNVNGSAPFIHEEMLVEVRVRQH